MNICCFHILAAINNATVNIYTNLHTNFMWMYVFFPLEYIHENFFNFRKTFDPIPHNNPALIYLFLKLYSRHVPPRGEEAGKRLAHS